MLSAMRSRRGVTLAEIMVALALVAIMITMVVSFALLISSRTQANAANDAQRRDQEILESGVEGWLAALALPDAEIELTSDSSVSATIYDKTYTLSFSHGTLSGELPDGKSITLSTSNVKSVTFELMTKDAPAKDYLLFCHVRCDDTASEQELTYTFCVNPHVGEKINNEQNNDTEGLDDEDA